MNITEMTAVMLAYENGAAIEFRHPGENDWFSSISPVFNWGICEYRVAEFPQEQDDDQT